MNPSQGLAFLFALIIGLSLGALGSGGSIVTLPVLVYVAHINPKSAVGMSMAIVGATSMVAAFLHWQRGRFHKKAALLLGVTGMGGAYLGSAFTHLVSSSTLLLMFAAIMLTVGLIMLRGGFQGLTPGECRPLRCAAVGAAVGVLTGFLGVGGGFLIVPALVLFAGLDTKKAVGTSLAIIAMNSFSGLFGQLRYASVDWQLTAGFTVLALAGMLIGLALSSRVSEPALRRAFAVLLLIVAVTVAGLVLF
ncbi:MAG: hypothetical protein NVS9B15_13230 [Acidobacteriaceae bacterium]